MRILLYMLKEYILPIDYAHFNTDLWEIGGNIGNRVFITALYKMLNTEYNSIDFCQFDKDLQICNYRKEEINEKFDAIVVPCLLFGVNSAEMVVIHNYIQALRGIKIPIYFFSLGSNVTNYSMMSVMEKKAGGIARELAELVFESGGGLATRGYFTQEFLEHIGVRGAVPTGCQSLFQNGRGLRIEKKNISRDDFKVIFNGHFDFLRRKEIHWLINKNPNSMYFDQDGFKDLIYREGEDGKCKEQSVLREVVRYSDIGLKLFYMKRLKFIGDIEEWENYLIQNEFCFSFGERIHGNIVSLLAGIPCFECWRDARTREMVEFFHIPGKDSRRIEKINLYEIYNNADYNEFNMTYKRLYDGFENYMKNTGLVKSLEPQLSAKSEVSYQNFQDYDYAYNMSEKERERVLNILRMMGYPVERWSIRAGQIKRLLQRINIEISKILKGA